MLAFFTTTAGIVFLSALAVIIFVSLFAWITVVVIPDDKVGIVTKKFGGPSLPNGSIIALNGESGVQADTLSPGWHFGYWPWQYDVERVNLIRVPEGEIALVIAESGLPIPDSRLLGDKVECDSFQDARAFLKNGGQKGRQLQKLTTGVYRINTRLFTVISTATAAGKGIDKSALRVLTIPANHVGIVTVHDGASLTGDVSIAAPEIEGHNSFQDENAFIKAGGIRGLQQPVIMPGTRTLNPWFVTVEVVPMLEIPKAYVGVVISYVGEHGEDVSGEDFKYNDIVENGKRGIWRKPLNPGMYPINPRTLHVELIPTSNFVLNFSEQTAEDHKLDEDLEAIAVRSSDGFELTMDVQQIIHIDYNVASRLIARFGTVSSLIQNTLKPLVSNYFRGAVQNCKVLDFVNSRTERQKEAREYINKQLKQFDVEGVETMIGEIEAPEDLMSIQRDRRLAEERGTTIDMQRIQADKDRALQEARALADQQPALVAASQAVAIAKSHAEAVAARASGEAQAAVTTAKAQAVIVEAQATADAAANKIRSLAEGEAKKALADNEAQAIKLMGDAEAHRVKVIGDAEMAVLQARIRSVGADNYAAIEVTQSLSTGGVKLVPDIVLGGSGSGENGSAFATMANLLSVQMLTNQRPGTPGLSPAVSGVPAEQSSVQDAPKA